ncbi:MAG: hypothetical protein H6Q82_736 [Deltaproteobacteria bacterium]|jgi:hypothetical protein|nr:hypothetical protein [Deltaproteobacteria bacterium]MBP2685406.1 hypothetical protein [Deltaproteobacteria bacterium]
MAISGAWERIWIRIPIPRILKKEPDREDIPSEEGATGNTIFQVVPLGINP